MDAWVRGGVKALELRRNGIGLPDEQHFDVFVRGEKLDRCRDRHANAVITTHAVDGKLDGHASLSCGFTCGSGRWRAYGTQTRTLCRTPFSKKAANSLAAFLFAS
jgi:hypothetical protein